MFYQEGIRLDFPPGLRAAAFERLDGAFQAGRRAEAVAGARRLVRTYPGCAAAWAHLGRFLGISGRAREGLRCLERALALDGESPAFWAWSGELCRRLGRSREAMRRFERGLRLDPADPLCLSWRGRLKMNLGRHRAALADFDKVLAGRAPSDKRRRAAAWKAGALWRLGRCREAARLFERLGDHPPNAAWNRGWRKDAAERRRRDSWKRRDDVFWRDLDRVVRLRPKDPWSWAFRGHCRLLCQRTAEGIADLEKALSLDPGNAYARKRLRRAAGFPA